MIGPPVIGEGEGSQSEIVNLGLPEMRNGENDRFLEGEKTIGDHLSVKLSATDRAIYRSYFAISRPYTVLLQHWWPSAVFLSHSSLSLLLFTCFFSFL